VRGEQRREVGDDTASRWRFREEGEGEEGTSGGGRCGVPGGDLGRKGRVRMGAAAVAVGGGGEEGYG
jgi:hypothetical protein